MNPWTGPPPQPDSLTRKCVPFPLPTIRRMSSIPSPLLKPLYLPLSPLGAGPDLPEFGPGGIDSGSGGLERVIRVYLALNDLAEDPNAVETGMVGGTVVVKGPDMICSVIAPIVPS